MRSSALTRSGLLAALVLLTVIAVGGLWFLHTQSGAGDIRHVVLISIDTCRPDYLSCYGYRRETTPNIDAVASQGVLFENVISPVPLTLPAHSTMMTGTIPPYHGVHDNKHYRLSDVNITLAEVLSDNGFATGAVTSSFTLNSVYGLNQGFDYYDDDFGEEMENQIVSQRRGDKVSELACQWLHDHHDEPFFLFIHYFDPHAEYMPPEPFASQYPNHYAGEIAYTDHCIGEVIAKLKELGLYDSTLLLITSDHGEMLGEHGEESHGYYVYQAAVRVPLIVKPPDAQPQPVRLKTTVGLVDIAPTILGSLKIDIPAEMQGVDLWKAVLSRPQKASLPQRDFFCEASLSTNYGCSPLMGVVTDRWKYILSPRPELYDLPRDSAEEHDLAAEQPQNARRMKAKLQKILALQSRTEQIDNTFTLSPEAHLKLQSLGYISSSAPETLEVDPAKPDPKDFIDLHINAARLRGHIVIQDYELAAELAKKMLPRYPDSFDVHLALGVIASHRGEFDTAIKHFRKCLRANPGGLTVRYHLGRALVDAQKLDPAMDEFKEILRLDPSAYKAHVDIGKILSRQNKFDEAIDHYTQSLQMDPQNADAHSSLARALSKQGRIDRAINHWKTALQIKENIYGVHLPLGLALSQTGQNDRAIPHLNAVICYDPNNADAHAALGVIFVQQEKLDEAISHYRRALQTKPDMTLTLTNFGKALAQQGKLDEAVKNWNLALELMEESSREYHQLTNLMAQQFLKHGRTERAIEQFEKLLRLTPESYQLHHNLGLLYYKQGKIQKAIDYWNRALALKPDSPQTMNTLAWVLATSSDENIRNSAGAIELAQHACQLSGFAAPTFLDTLAAAYAAGAQFDRAAETAKKALSLIKEPENATQFAEDLKKRLALYQKKQPYLE